MLKRYRFYYYFLMIIYVLSFMLFINVYEQRKNKLENIKYLENINLHKDEEFLDKYTYFVPYDECSLENAIKPSKVLESSVKVYIMDENLFKNYNFLGQFSDLFVYETNNIEEATVILGSNYKNIFKIGDNFELDVKDNIIKALIIGFFDECQYDFVNKVDLSNVVYISDLGDEYTKTNIYNTYTILKEDVTDLGYSYNIDNGYIFDLLEENLIVYRIYSFLFIFSIIILIFIFLLYFLISIFKLLNKNETIINLFILCFITFVLNVIFGFNEIHILVIIYMLIISLIILRLLKLTKKGEKNDKVM